MHGFFLQIGRRKTTPAKSKTIPRHCEKSVGKEFRAKG
jgi:hypothetical protein